ncbi:uncharacterized protein LOC114366316 [Ostrinia furnacalis]|uniref:uncharacterized protein LOC114366316 n=1 Tax=Ostrinia furnacalis TaxID=93504 RepID=UPI001038B588|nr:uncharacterized protein LOC114366316 [Ostrinia furnacalis]
MKNTPTLKSLSKVDSPKTPGGISKSLLTPCRRVGLSRNWRKSGPSPFISPLAGNAEVKVEKIEPRKRKKRHDDEELASGSSDTTVSKDVHIDEDHSSNIEDIETTPSRNVSTPQRKKSKTLLASRIVNKESSDVESLKVTNEFVNNADTTSIEECTNTKIIEDTKKDLTDVVTPVRSKSKGKISRIKPTVQETVKVVDSKENVCVNENISNELSKNTKQKSPENLTKECIVVIQKKIFKKDIKSIEKDKPKQETAIPKSNPVNPISQILFDSDSDDVPLVALNKNEIKEEKSKNVIPVDDDDDFDNTCKIKVKKLVDKTTSIGGLRADSSKKKCKEKQKATSSKCKEIEPKVCTESKPSSQSSFDDDDFVTDNRRTILIRKSYDKVTKPSKAKSTGSITLKDIEDLKDRIEVKKKLLLAKATEDSKELRDLIKKWQKGCQDALMELMELMKNKFPDKQNMDYAEILQTLKIPSSLVGYDEDNDCFNTPTDENIILSKFNT